jgi:aspartate/methionine/tyrosine aminotransferase
MQVCHPDSLVSAKGKKITPFVVMEILEKAQALERSGARIIHLEIGEPDFDTPEIIKEAALKALSDGKVYYTHSLGILELREAIAKHYYNKYRVTFSPEQVIVTMGTSAAMLLLFAALLDKGDLVILPSPHYSCYPNFVAFCEGEVVFIPLMEEEGFQFSSQGLPREIPSHAKAIIINSPSNPAGTMIPPEGLAKLAELGIWIISDEIYHGMVYEGKEHTILEYTDRAFVVNGFSKLYAMTGWRLGYLIAPREFIRPLQKLQQNFFISASSFVQWAGLVALEEAGEAVQNMLRIYNERRIYMLQRLREIGFRILVEPTGAFYILANAQAFCQYSYPFALELLEKVGVGVAPGIDFGQNTEGFIRFTYANSLENIAEAMDRLEQYLCRRK